VAVVDGPLREAEQPGALLRHLAPLLPRGAWPAARPGLTHCTLVYYRSGTVSGLSEMH
jgi:hypothetical protein